MRIISGIIIFIWSLSFYTHACFTVAAGKDATQDGSVMLGHNEDNDVNDLAGIVHYPASINNKGRRDMAYTAIEMPYLTFADNVINEHGVTIVSNMCTSREDREDITNKGIGGRLFRHTIIRQTSTAREAVLLVGKFVETYGYIASGRTLTICDPNEAWMVALVKGRHWVAARVPDDEVACIANTYTIGQVNLEDTNKFLGAKDIIDYAFERGWYDPKDGPFDFEKAYALPSSRYHLFNLNRQNVAISELAGKRSGSPEPNNLPFSIKPAVPLSIKQMFRLLRNHTEPVSEKQLNQLNRSPHDNAYTICNHKTNYSSVYQLRNFMPKEVGILWWSAFWNPCASPYLPVYPLIGAVDPARKFHFNQKGLPIGPGTAYRFFYDLRNDIHGDFSTLGVQFQLKWKHLENENFDMQKSVESKAAALWKENPISARKLLMQFSQKTLYKAMKN